MITLINHQGLKVMRGIQLQSPSPPIGLAYIGGALKRHGYSYTAIDACGEAMDQIQPYPDLEGVYIQGLTQQQILDRIPKSTKIIGFTCLFSHCWPLVHELSLKIKACFPETLLVVGGEHGTALPEHTLRTSPFDLIVMGEGEETFLELVQKIDANEEYLQIPGIAYLQDDQYIQNCARKRITEIDDFPYPDWDSWCIEAYIEHQQVTGINLGRSMPILGSRGCPYDCKFCSNLGMWTRRYLIRGAKALVDEMEYMCKKYHVGGFTFMDLTFVINRRKTLAFAQELIQRNLDIHYQLPAGTRCEAFDEELTFALADSGLKNFAFAPESGSEEVLKAIRKQISIPKLLDTVKIVLKTDMTIGCFIVIGFPEDSKISMRETATLIRKLAIMGIHDVTISKFTPYPGSDYFRELLQDGQLQLSVNNLAKVINFYSDENTSYSPHITSRQLHHWMLYMYMSFYLLSFLRRPWRFINHTFLYFTKGVEVTRYMRLIGELFNRRQKWKELAR